MLRWRVREPTFEFQCDTYFAAAPTEIDGRFYYCFFSQFKNGDRWTGWILSDPGHLPVAYIDAKSKDNAQEFCEWFMSNIGG
jgi:hypothetical protein